MLLQLQQKTKEGSTDLSDIISMVVTSLLLIVFVILFMAPGITKDKKEEIKIRSEISTRENLFVINSFLQTPINDSHKISDLINLWLLDPGYEQRLKDQIDLSLGEAYGNCYGLEIKDLKVGRVDKDKKVCLDYPNFGNKINICLDISKYDEELKSGEVKKCF